MVPICRLSLPEKTFRRDFGMITTWYLQSQRTWDKLCHSCRGSSFLPRGAFPEGRAYAIPQRLHAGSLEALRVSRPEAVVLAVNNPEHSTNALITRMWATLMRRSKGV